ncbi:MAG: nitrate reductase molybdenum cofactor assembly chaperone [Actinomycetes bacterium]
MDTVNRAQTHQVCSVLLRYPDDSMPDLLPLIGDIVAGLPEEAAAPLGGFLDYLATAPLLEVQRHYVDTFDMRRKCSPYMTYWTHGDTRNRGMALLHFKEAYREAGVTIDEEELPDHLAVVLEFAATCDSELGNALLAEHRGVIALLHTALADTSSPYAAVVDAVLRTTSALTAEDELLMQKLALNGPPTETVGMAGPVDLTLTPFGVQSSDMAMEARR